MLFRSVPVAERTRHMQIPYGKMAEHRIELRGLRRADGKRLLYESHPVGRKLRELVACKRLLPGERDDGSLHLRLLALQRRLVDEHAVRVAPEHV